MKQVFGKFDTKKYSQDIAAMAGVSQKDVEKFSQKDILDRVVRQTAIDLDKQMKEQGIAKGVGISDKDIEEALKEGQGTEKFQELQKKLEQANQELITRMQEDADPQTKALHHIEEIMEGVRSDLLKNLQIAKAGNLGEFFDTFSAMSLDFGLQGLSKGGQPFGPGETGIMDQAAFLDIFTGGVIS